MSDENPTPDSESVGPVGSNPRYAAYDKTYQRFVGGVHYSKSDARDAAKDAGAKRVEIREV